MDKRKLIIDCDPGIDDAFAIIAAMKSEEFEILGITAVAGNMRVNTTWRNAGALITALNYPCKAYKGAANSLTKLDVPDTTRREVVTFHGPTGFGHAVVRVDPQVLSEQDAVDFILEMVDQYPEEVEILALGPLTNLALAIQKDPETFKKTKWIYSMGGGINRHNASPYAEFNYFDDALSVKTVIDFAKYVPFYMGALDATHGIHIDYNDLAELRLSGTAEGRFLAEIGTYYADSYHIFSHIHACVVHDAYVFMAMKSPELVEEMTEYPIHVYDTGERSGQTAVEDNGTVVHVMMKFDAEHMHNRLLKLVTK